jgi:hypothetical protein
MDVPLDQRCARISHATIIVAAAAAAFAGLPGFAFRLLSGSSADSY